MQSHMFGWQFCQLRTVPCDREPRIDFAFYIGAQNMTTSELKSLIVK